MVELENRRKDKPTPPQTNLSISITGADEANEWQNTIYNMILTMTGVQWAENVVATVTLPANIDYVASVDWVNAGQTITWTIGDLVGNYTRQFTITSDNIATGYEITAVLTTDTANIGTATASKVIDVVEAPSGPILGCMDPEAINYNPNATEHDDNCQY